MLNSILIVSSKSDLSGAPIHTATLAEGLSERKLNVTIAYSGNGEAYKNLNPSIKKILIPGLANNATPYQSLKAVEHIRALINSQHYDVIHSHSTKAGLVSRIAKIISRIPITSVYTVHGWPFGAGKKLTSAFLGLVIELIIGRWSTDTYVTVSRYDEVLGKKFLRIGSRKILTVHNGIPDEPDHQHTVPTGDFHYIMIARTSYQKNHRLAAQSYAQVQTPARLSFVGSGTDDPAFKKEMLDIIKPNSSRQVQFLGQRYDITQLLSSAHALILPSRYEGLPIAIIEAMRSARPFVASDVGGVQELTNGNGILVKRGPNEIADFTAAMDAIRDESLWTQMSERSRNHYMRHHSIDAMTTSLIEVYKK